MNKNNQIINCNPDIKLYSKKAIGIATFLGGPLGAGVLMRQNYLNIGAEDVAKRTLLISIVGTIMLFTIIFTLPDSIIDKIPNSIIPAIYTLIIYFIVERLMGSTLEVHERENGVFYSSWKAAGIGITCGLVLLAGLFSYAHLAPDDFDTQTYDAGMERFQQNENEALSLFSNLETWSVPRSLRFIDETGIPAWQDNIQILNQLDTITGLYPEFKHQNKVLREYCELRIESYKLLKKALSENTTEYDRAIFAIRDRINELLDSL